MIEEFVGSKGYRSMSVKEMAMVLQVPSRDKKDFREVLDALAREGKISIDLKGKIKPLPADVKVGKYMATQRGFGFVRVEGEDDDIFIPGSYTKSALDGDTVQVLVKKEGGEGKRREGQVLNILERGNSVLVGTYTRSRNFGFVTPDNQKFTKDIYVAKAESKGAVTGHKVVVEITDFGDEQRKPEGRVLEILGHVNDPGVDILSVIKAYGLPEEYPDDVMKQIENIPDEVEEKEKAGRADFRDLQTVTIDGEDAKDLDDAITISREAYGYRLGVHIADVSHYVTENSPLDQEALRRGTSVYLVDRVIPMLPHKLSNGICSLNEGTDRLALSCIMDLDFQGRVLGHEVAETVIQVDRRMTYTAVNAIVTDQDPNTMEEYRDFTEMFALMKELADILRERRYQRGSIDFDFPETKMILDEKGRPVEIRPYERNAATRIIEDFMLMANETIAEDYFWQEVPFLYRTHDTPDPEKMKRLGLFINNFGYTIRTQQGEVHPKEIQKLLKKIEGSEEEALISRLTLRSMRQAKYMPVCSGHFGLAAKYYTHFTSPIRRYPDLQIHRIIKENLHGNLTEKRLSHYDKLLTGVSIQCSATERRAEEAERETIKMKKCEYMAKRIGREYEGVISGVTNWGIYVELPNTIEGMVHVSILPGDYYYYDEKTYSMVGERTGRTFKLGEKAKIRVKDVDMMLKNIDFELVEDDDYEQSEDGWN